MLEVLSGQVFEQKLVVTYNVFVQIKMARTDYVRAKAEAIEKIKDEFDKAGNIEAKKKAELILDELKSEVM